MLGIAINKDRSRLGNFAIGFGSCHVIRENGVGIDRRSQRQVFLSADIERRTIISIHVGEVGVDRPCDRNGVIPGEMEQTVEETGCGLVQKMAIDVAPQF